VAPNSKTCVGTQSERDVRYPQSIANRILNFGRDRVEERGEQISNKNITTGNTHNIIKISQKTRVRIPVPIPRKIFVQVHVVIVNVAGAVCHTHTHNDNLERNRYTIWYVIDFVRRFTYCVREESFYFSPAIRTRGEKKRFSSTLEEFGSRDAHSVYDVHTRNKPKFFES